MTDWRETTLGEVVDILDYKRVPLSRTQRANRQGPYPYYGAQGIIDHINDFIFEGRFILIPEDGENLRSRKLPIAYFADGQFWVNNHAHIVKAKSGVANDRFVQSVLGASDIDPFITGAAQPKLSQANLRRIPILLPPPEEQDVIAGLLDALDDLIENNRRRIELLEQMAQAIYREWFVRFRYPGHEDATLVDSPLGPIPEGWTVKNLFEVADVGFGYSFKSKRFGTDGPFAVVRIRNVPSGTTKTFSDEHAAERYRVVDGDVLIGMDGDFHLRQWTGGPAWLNQRVARLRPLGGLSARHLMLAIEAPIKEWNTSISGTTVAHLGKRHLEQIRILLPSREVLALASEVLADVANQSCALVQSGRQLATIRDLLLPKLVTGEIDVSKLDLDILADSTT